MLISASIFQARSYVGIYTFFFKKKDVQDYSFFEENIIVASV